MNKRLLLTIISLALLISLTGCRGDNGQKGGLNEFNQVFYSEGDVIYSAGPYTYTITDYDEILKAFSCFKESGNLNRYTYSFNNLADGIAVCHILNSYDLENKGIDDITDATDFLNHSGKINLSTSLIFDGNVCTLCGSSSSENSHTAYLTLLFDKTQPTPPKVVSNSLLSYREAELFTDFGEHYCYEILYNNELLFYAVSCIELSDSRFNELFVDSLVQYDVSEN